MIGNFFKKKIAIPSGEQHLDAAYTWTVSWKSRYGEYMNEVRNEIEVFFSLEDARQFKSALEDALKLLKDTNRGVYIKDNQTGAGYL